MERADFADDAELKFTPLHCSLFGAAALQMISHACIIFMAKAINSAVTATFTPELTCSEEAPGTVKALVVRAVSVIARVLLLKAFWLTGLWRPRANATS